MEKNNLPDATPHSENENTPGNTEPNNLLNRRKFVEMTAAAGLAFTIVPRHVLGGKNYIAPSDKITLAYIGVGTQGIRELLPMLQVPQIQVVAVCDPNKNPVGYSDWGMKYLKSEFAAPLKNQIGTHLVII